jgi:hypothetical protein
LISEVADYIAQLLRMASSGDNEELYNRLLIKERERELHQTSNNVALTAIPCGV